MRAVLRFGPWLDFHRRFTWNLKASGPKSVQVDFTKGMRQIPPSENCSDMHTYTLKAFQKTGTVLIGKYCRTGPISGAQILNQGSFSLDVPPGLEVQSDYFALSGGEDIKCKLVSKYNLLHLVMNLKCCFSFSSCQNHVSAATRDNFL